MQQNPQNISNFHLAHIHQQISTQPNGSQTFVSSTLTDPTEPFIPPTSCVWANGLWFLSLVISLTAALTTTLLQHWARRYLRLANPRRCPHEKARIREFYRHGVEKLYIPWTIEAVPALLHLSLFLFFAGLSVFLFDIHYTIFKLVTAWVSLCGILYAYFTFLPIIYKDSPYSAPPSVLVSSCLTGIRCVFRRMFRQFDPSMSLPLYDFSPRRTEEEFALRRLPDIDHQSLLWTFESLYDDTDLEKFFEGLSRLCDSGTGTILNIHEGFIKPHRKKLSSALIGLMNRTLSSNLVTEFVKQRRMIICTKAVDSTSLLGPWWILRSVLLGEWSKFLECIEFGLFVQNCKNVTDKVTFFYAQCVASLTISILPDRNRDERWFQLASGLLNAPKCLLHKYIAHGDSMLLADTIFILRRTVQTYSGAKTNHRKDILEASSKTLETVCKLKIEETLPELQHEFCELWNQLVHTANTDQYPHHAFIAKMTLENIRKLYIFLHGRSGRPPTCYTTTDDQGVPDILKSYPVCTIDDHRSLLPVQDLQFDEQKPDAQEDVPTPTFVYSPTRSSNFTPFDSSHPAPGPHATDDHLIPNLMPTPTSGRRDLPRLTTHFNH